VKTLAVSVVATVLFATWPAMAGVKTFDPSSATVWYAANDGGFWTRATQIPASGSSPGLNATSSIVGGLFHVTASGSSYSDAGIVLYFDGTLHLGDLQSVSITSTGSPLSMNLWLDSGGDGKFFSYDANGLLTGLNGDSYAGHDGNTHDTTSPFYILGGYGAGNTYTLRQLQSGAVAGISAATPVALWIGIANSGGSSLVADIGSVAVTTASVPTVPALPGSTSVLSGVLLSLLGFLLLGRTRRGLDSARST
jgi:hypothetical protein